MEWILVAIFCVLLVVVGSDELLGLGETEEEPFELAELLPEEDYS